MSKKEARNRWLSLSVVGMALTAVYAICVPIFDVRHKLSSKIGDNFLDSQHNITTFNNYLYFITYIPLLVFSALWAYGVYKGFSEKHKPHATITAVTIFIPIVSLIIYFVLDVCFGFYYHFKF